MILGQSRPVWEFLWSSNSEDNVEKVEGDKQSRREEGRRRVISGGERGKCSTVRLSCDKLITSAHFTEMFS